MPGLEPKQYLSRIGIRRINQLDTALLEAFGPQEGERHIERLTELFDQSEDRLLYGTGDTVYLHRQEELVDYWNQSLQMSLLAASFYDRVFFRRVMEYLLEHDSFWSGDIFDIGCGNGILTCFLALQHPGSVVTGLEISPNAVSVARELARELGVDNIHFSKTDTLGQCHTLFSCRTAHENVPWRPLCEKSRMPALSMEQQVRLHSQYAKELSTLIRPQGHLISIERYEEDDAYAGLVFALERVGFCQVKGTHMQFSCKNGDGMATFQAMIFRKAF